MTVSAKRVLAEGAGFLVRLAAAVAKPDLSFTRLVLATPRVTLSAQASATTIIFRR